MHGSACPAGFGHHPLLCWLDNTGEALAGRLRPGNAGANTATDHIAVLDDALTQIPDEYRHGTPFLVRADGAGCSKDFLAHVRSPREQGVHIEFSVGFTMIEAVKAAIDALPAWACTDGAFGEVAEPEYELCGGGLAG
jgi:hypothetical protein